MNEQELIAARNQLRTYRIQHPDWSIRQLSQRLGLSCVWVIKWLKRLEGSRTDDFEVLKSQSRAPKAVPSRFHEAVEDAVIRLRDKPPEEILFVPGPRTMLTYLHQNEQLQAHKLPKSPTTVWKILVKYQRIARPSPRERHPFECPDARDTWEIDFTDAISGAIEDDKRKKHGVEVFNVVDRGSSVWVDTEARSDFDAEQALVSMLDIFIRQGIPNTLVFDNDPRFVGSWISEGYPSAFMRFLLCLGVDAKACPPRRPQDKPFVERLHRSLKSECIRRHKLETLDDVREKIAIYHQVYNYKRPNQSKVCRNQPPMKAVGTLPTMKQLPSEIDPDKWLDKYHNQYFTRQVTSKGSIQIGKYLYYVGIDCAGQRVSAIVDAHAREFRIQTTIGEKRKPIKGLIGEPMTFDRYVSLIIEEARSEQRRLAHRRLRKR